jgi:hypothetical protein
MIDGMRGERVNLFDLAIDPGPQPEDPGQRPPEEQVEAVRSWEAKLAAFGVWTTRHRRFQLGKCLKSLREIPIGERVPLSKTDDFTSYTKEGFGPKDQARLAETMDVLKNKKHARVLLSNAGSRKVEELYRGFNIEEVRMRRNISCKSSGRDEVLEYLIS